MWWAAVDSNHLPPRQGLPAANQENAPSAGRGPVHPDEASDQAQLWEWWLFRKRRSLGFGQ